MMKTFMKRATVALLASGMLAGVAHADILGLRSNGDVLTIDVLTGNAVLRTNVGDPDPQTTPGFSPNSLGNNGSLFNTNFGSTTTLYENGGAVGTITGSNVASGAAVGNTFYYMTGSTFRTVGTNGSGTTAFNLNNGASTYGDIEVRGGKAYVSFTKGGAQAYFASFNLDGTGYQESTAARQYAGLAFSGSQLYGLTGPGLLYALSLAGVESGGSTQVSLDGQNVTDITDAAVVPLPAAAWLLLAGLGGMGLVAWRRKAA